MQLSVIIPARNEVAGLGSLVPEVTRLLPQAEIIVVGSWVSNGPIVILK